MSPAPRHASSALQCLPPWCTRPGSRPQDAIGTALRGLAAFFRSPWASFDFQTDLLRTLRGAVLWGDPEAMTEVNVNLDMHDNFNRPAGRPGWREAVGQWRTLTDIGALANLYLLHGSWMTDRMPALVQAVENHWGVYGPEGEPLPALAVVQAIARDTQGARS